MHIVTGTVVDLGAPVQESPLVSMFVLVIATEDTIQKSASVVLTVVHIARDLRPRIDQTPLLFDAAAKVERDLSEKPLRVVEPDLDAVLLTLELGPTDCTLSVTTGGDAAIADSDW